MNDNNTNPINQAEPAELEISDKYLENLSDEETIDLFVRGIMHEKGTDEGSDEVQNSIFNDLKTELLKQIDRSLIFELPDDKLEEFNRLATENGQLDPNMVAQAVADAGIDVNEVTAGTMQKFREVYLGLNNSDETEPIEAEPNEGEGNN